MKKIRKDFGFGGARVDSFSQDNLRELLVQIVAELEKIRQAFNSHTHNAGAVPAPDQTIAALEIEEEK